MMSDEKQLRVRLTPQLEFGEVVKHGRCVYGVSIGTPKPLADMVTGYIWAASHFDRCAILLGDGLYRITLQTREGLDETTAARRAIAEGSAVVNELELALGTGLEIFRSSSLMLRPAFQSAFTTITGLYESDHNFRASVDNDASDFIDRQARAGRLAVPTVEATRQATLYLIEEISMYLVLAEDGWLVDVYLGRELGTLALIIRGEIAAAPQALKERINIALSPK